MPLFGDAVDAALERWEQKALLPAEQIATLRAEVREHQRGSTRRVVQYALAATGAAVLLVAVGVLSDWLWPRLEPAGRVLVLGLTGALAHGAGLALGRGERWRAASYLLQITGLLVLLGTYAYSEDAWPKASAGGVVVGLLALATPLLTAPRSLLRRDPVMPAAHLALSLAFLAVFLWRALAMEPESIVWVLDGVLAGLALLLVARLRHASEGEGDWALNAFVAALYAGLVLVVLTAVGPLGMEREVVYPIDLWVAGIAALSLWGIHLAPPALQRGWYERQLGLAVLAAVPLVFATADSLWRAPPELTALLLVLLGAAALRYAVRHGARTTLLAACVALISAAWHFGLSRGGALGVVVSLLASAALLFWISTRIGWGREAVPPPRAPAA